MKGVLISRVVGRVLGAGEDREKCASRAASCAASPEVAIASVATQDPAFDNDDGDEDDEMDTEGDRTINRCMVCDEDLSGLDEASKERHTQQCVGHLTCSEQQDAAVPLAEGGLFAASFFCILCDLNLSRRKILHRCWHLKRCARKNNLSTKALLQQIAPIHEAFSQSSSDSDQLNPPTASENQPSERNALAVLMSNAKQQSKLNGFSLPNSSSSAASSKENNPSNSFISKKRPLSSSANSSSTPKPVRASSSGSTKSNKKSSSSARSWSHGGGESYSFAPAYKKIQVGKMAVPIVVDGFQYASSTLSEYYFLTHFHSDHYIGLSADFDCGKIFCSTVTAGLVQSKLKVPVSCLVALQLNTQYTFTIGGERVEVVMIDANHCPGAVVVVFYFPSLSRWIVHTGDFRFDRDVMLRSSSILRQLAQNGSQQVNAHLTVYLDTTYCDPAYTFPSQQDVIQAVVAAMQQECQQSGTLLVFGAYTIGKERLFMSTAAALGKRVFVDKTRWKTTLCFDWSVEEQALLTTDPVGADIWVVGMHQVSFNALPGLLLKARQAGGSYRRVVGVQPTGWNHASSPSSRQTSTEEGGGTGLSVRRKGDCVLYAASYSEHSSFPELVDFIRVFKPMRVIPTVNTQADKAQEQLALLKQASGIYDNECG